MAIAGSRLALTFAAFSALLLIACGGDDPITSGAGVTSDRPITIRNGGSADEPRVYDGEGLTVDVGCESDHNIVVRADNVVIRNYTLLNASSSAVIIDGSEDEGYENVVVENVDIRGFNCDEMPDQFAAGVACWGCTALTVRDSHIETDREYGNGIWLKNYDPERGGGHQFLRNTIAGGWDGIGGEPETEVYGGVYRDTLIESNTVTGCHDDGIQVEGGNIDVRVAGNTVSRCPVGVAFAPNLQGPLYIEDNVITDLVLGSQDQQFGMKVGLEGAGTAYLSRNVISSAEGGGIFQTNAGLSPIVTDGNCIDVEYYAIALGGLPPDGTAFNSDQLYTSDDSRFVEWDGTKYRDIESFHAATGQEPDGVQAAGCDLSGASP